MTTAYAFVPSPGHEYPGHPERPERLAVLEQTLPTLEGVERIAAAPAAREHIAAVHTPRLIAGLERACHQGPAIIDYAPTFITRTSFADALLAAGATLACTRAVLSGAARNAFAIVRPPGHHAEPERAMGFCLFNNVAIAARQALTPGMPRVLIVDYDAHHGNGTQAAFFDEPRVAYLSTHQWGIYPGTGWIEDAPQARKRIVNVPLPAYAGDRTFAGIADEIVAPLAKSFRPEMIFVSVGFDAHWRDPITMLGLSTAGYYAFAKRLVDLAKEHCGGKIVFVLEGGYDPHNVANGAQAVFAALTGKDAAPPVEDVSPHAEPDCEARIAAVCAWHGF